MSKLLINEPPLQVLPSLAKAIGLNEAMLLQQIHFWLGKVEPDIEGIPWVNKTYEGWQVEFPFWSVDTIKRIIHSLEKSGHIVSTADKNRRKMDRAKWYTIDYSKFFDRAISPDHEGKLPPRAGQSAPLSSGQVAPSNINKIENKKEEENKSAIRRIYPFEEFYADFPNKKNPAAAERAHQKLYRGLNHTQTQELDTEIRDGLAAAKASAEWAKDDGQWIPYPASWLNAHGFRSKYTPRGKNHDRPGNAIEQVRDAFADLKSSSSESGGNGVDRRGSDLQHEMD